MMTMFNEMELSGKVLKAVEELGYEKPMPIQEKVIPYLLKEDASDIIALAQTGTGKTAAFGLPLIQLTDTNIKNTQHLILCPTRELCIQIADDLNNFSKYVDGLKLISVYGGTSIDKQIQQIRRGVHIIVATPGRLLDLIRRKVVNITTVKTVVLDEADEMLDMGFRDDLEDILNETPDTKQVLLFSATMPKEVMNITNRYMKSPVELSVGTRNAGAENVTHLYYTVHARDRYLALKRIVDFYPSVYGIVFCRTRQETKDVADKLMQDGYNADALHGDLSQAQRDIVMHKFRIRHLRLLVATDVAARGIDVDDLTHIINYNLPDEIEAYTHRSGRTGRAGKKGISVAIINMKEKGKIKLIEKQIKRKFTHMPVPVGTEICEKQLFHLIDRMEKVEVDEAQIEPYFTRIFNKLEWLNREDLIKKFISVEFNRFLEYYRNAPDLNIPESDSKREKFDKSRKSNVDSYTRFFINIGRIDNIKPTTVIGLIKDHTRIPEIPIGDIEILKTFSFFEVEAGYEKEVIDGFKNANLKGRDINVEVAEKKANPRSDRSRRSGGGKTNGRSGGGRGEGSRNGSSRGEGSGNNGKSKSWKEIKDKKRKAAKSSSKKKDFSDSKSFGEKLSKKRKNKKRN